MIIKELEIKDLKERINEAKEFLNKELTLFRTSEMENHDNFKKVGFQLDSIHEVERCGVRNLSDFEFIKIQRILTSIEARMELSSN